MRLIRKSWTLFIDYRVIEIGRGNALVSLDFRSSRVIIVRRLLVLGEGRLEYGLAVQEEGDDGPLRGEEPEADVVEPGRDALDGARLIPFPDEVVRERIHDLALPGDDAVDCQLAGLPVPPIMERTQ